LNNIVTLNRLEIIQGN